MHAPAAGISLGLRAPVACRQSVGGHLDRWHYVGRWHSYLFWSMSLLEMCGDISKISSRRACARRRQSLDGLDAGGERA